ncbi:hypothetical protein JTE90_006523 [Oedothorax gibbosus]|uniref:ATP-binding cassette sub-family D member 4 n=1 Tax=Oedothorax gibbosus TaxID=931172 RepID=A0AAV6TZV8_9ARAC|nr:hypothetical protein JTE90_006523 [Oedothorax gibbosus]
MADQTERVSLCAVKISSPPKNHGFGIFTIRRLCRILKIIFSKNICVLFLILICLMALLEQYLVYNIGIVPSGFFKVLGEKDLNAFLYHLVKATLLILAICFVLSCKKYLLNVFYVSSREILTDKLHALYFSQNKFYILNTIQYDSTDNPDQRITQDVEKFCKQFSLILAPFVVAPFTITYYSYNCYTTTGWIGPVAIFLIFLISVLVNKLLIKPIMGLVIRQEKNEGFFRFKHMFVRSNAESIAFQNANYAEMSRSNHKLTDLIKVQQLLYLREFPLDVCVNIFSYMGSIVSYLILAYPIFNGKYDGLSPVDLSALISMNAFVAIFLMSCFSSLINISANISALGGLVHRVCEIIDTLRVDFRELEDPSSEPDSETKLELHGSIEPAITLQNVTFSPPRESKALITNLNIQIEIGSNLLITGKSSSGKTSLFRVIKGLWPIQEGSISRALPFLPSVMFVLPQHPLLSDGPLIEQIVYPLDLARNVRPRDEELEKLLGYLNYVDLNHLLKKAGLFDVVDWNWCDILSPGEAQRLSFVRLFCHRPKIAFLDEATSAVSAEVEEKLYTKCRELGITVVSIGHRSSLARYHHKFLHLNGDGSWTLSKEPHNS